MPCWREFNPVQWNWLLKITASSQTTSLDSFTPSPPSGCCRTPLWWSPTPSWAKQAIRDARSSPTVRAWGLHKSFELDSSPHNCPLALYPPAARPGCWHLHGPPARTHTPCCPALPSGSIDVVFDRTTLSLCVWYGFGLNPDMKSLI